MIVYAAGIYTGNFGKSGNLFRRLKPAEQEARLQVEHYLESYHYIHKQSFVDKLRRDGISVFLDSGAFSAFTQGISVDLEAYCDYIKRNSDIITVCSVLDGIGDPQLTYENQLRMEKLGTRPLPCFHYGEDERYLEYYLANYEYITLGGMVPISTPNLKKWLDRIWEDYLIDGAGYPKVRVHGFGLTTISLMERYPWYSVDSSAWVQAAASGSIMTESHGTVAISSASPSRKMRDRHFDTIAKIEQEKLREVIENDGFLVSDLRDNYLSRWTYNCYAFVKMNRRYAEVKPYQQDQMRLF